MTGCSYDGVLTVSQMGSALQVVQPPGQGVPGWLPARIPGQHQRLARTMERMVNDNTLVALALLVAESLPAQKELMIRLIEHFVLLKSPLCGGGDGGIG